MNKRITASKLLLLVSYIIGIALAVIVILGTFMGFEMSNVTTITVTSWAEIAVANAFYYMKARNENVIKIISSVPTDVLEKIDTSVFFSRF